MSKSKRSRFSIEVGLSTGSVYASLAEQAFWWFVRGSNLESVESGKRHIVVNILRYRDIKCNGQIQIRNQDKIDLQQYETGEWVDDGEGEAENRQYDLADEFWEQGLTLNI